MRQTFFHELNELEKREKQEKKEKVQLYMRSKSVMLRDSLPWVATILTVVFLVLAGTYATYLFVDLTRINDVANVHMTKNIKLAARSLQGSIYNAPEKGIKNWMLHKDMKNGFEIAHPENWIMADYHLFEIKKYNSQRSANESLSAAVFIDQLENPSNSELMEIVAMDSGLKKEQLKLENKGEYQTIRIGKQKEASGLSFDKVYWQREGNIYYLKAVYYNQNNKDAENDFNMIVAELKIL